MISVTPNENECTEKSKIASASTLRVIGGGATVRHVGLTLFLQRDHPKPEKWVRYTNAQSQYAFFFPRLMHHATNDTRHLSIFDERVRIGSGRSKCN